MITGNKISGFADRIATDRRPVTADIFLTNYCNEKCKYCRFAHTEGDYMNYDTFVSYALRLLDMGVRGFILTGGGEPSLNPDFYKICRWLQLKGIRYGVNTNLVDLHYITPTFLKVSIDAGTPEEYRRIRGVDMFERVKHNLWEYIAYKKGNHLGTAIGIQCVATSKQTVVDFYETFKSSQVDYIYFRPFENHNGHITQPDVMDAIDEICKSDPRVNKSYKFNSMRRMPACLGNWTVINVNWDGTVAYCCHRPNDIVGHINDGDILEKLRRYNVDMSQCDIPCRLSGVNEYLLQTAVVEDYCFV